MMMRKATALFKKRIRLMQKQGWSIC